MTGEVLVNRYEIQQQLGKKAGRRTLLACDLQTHELVVIKLLSFGSDFEWDSLKLFEREAETLKSLSHSCIPRYLDYFEVNSPTLNGFALVQSYIPAQTLEQYLQNGRTFTEIEIKQIAQAVLEILAYLHGLHPPVIHRDLKPSNILLGERSGNNIGQVFLVDFGAVQTVLATEGATRTVVGTYGYMPPEQFGGRTVPASDLYSLGATLIYLVTGIHPADLPQKDFRIQFEHLADVSPSFRNWLQRMVEPNLERRLHSAVAALSALEQSPLPNIATLTTSKPAESQIQLTKSSDDLEILIPSPGFQPSLIFLGLFAIAWNSFILFWTIGALSAPFPVNLPFALFSLPFWGAGGFMLYGFLFNILGRTRLYVDRQQIDLTYELLGFKFRRFHPSPRPNITKLVYIPQHFTKDAEDNRTQVSAQLDIWVGVKKYQLGGTDHGIKSDLELEWLAHELSDWLNLPIHRE
ncbi:serine/threonine protein kinase [Fortiea contorta]|uniref:serine/threonine protein kinase n=1 Tax=Fortiea contorta TaxID=1892405 RepID=UPI000346857A|nr:serine/threonine-protein kinase [Fortiea contorta]